MADKYNIKGQGPLALSPKDFVAQGGQGSVYLKGKTAYKIYANPNRDMIPLGKIQDLSRLNQPYIVRPLDVIWNQKNEAVGYTMYGLQDAYALCQMFPKAFRLRNKITPDMALELVRKLQAGVKYVHSVGDYLIVDLNEMNFSITDSFDEIYFLDVDSYKTPNFPATALMESVRDRHTKGFNQGTDWFSFGIVSFQMFVGIHPYKGQYDKLDNVPKTERLNARMEKNVSVFNKEVRVPAVTLPFDVIPPVYQQWYEAVFEKGVRTAPPDTLRGVLILAPAFKVQKQAGSNNFVIEELHEYIGDVVSFTEDYVVTTHGIYKGGRELLPTKDGGAVGFVPVSGEPVLARTQGKKLFLTQLRDRKPISLDLYAQNVMSYGGSLYTQSENMLLELVFKSLGGRTVVTTRKAAGLMANSAKMFDGVVIHTMLDQYHAVIVPKSGLSYQLPLKELDGFQIVDAKFREGVLIVVGAKGGKYDKFIMRYSPDFASHDCRVINDITTASINFTVLDNGIVLHLNEDDLEVFSSRKDSTNMKAITDPALAGDVKLMSIGVQPLFARGNKLFKFNMKK